MGLSAGREVQLKGADWTKVHMDWPPSLHCSQLPLEEISQKRWGKRKGRRGQEGKTVDSVLTTCPWIMTSFSLGWKWRLREMDDGDLHKRAPPVRSRARSLPQMGFVPKHMSLCSPTFYSVPLLGGLCPIWGNWAVKDAGWISPQDEITKRGGVLFLVSVSKETLSFSELQ